MRSPVSAMTVIVCPHCGTRYQVPVETLGPKGREVACAHCSRTWQAVPGDGTRAPAPETDADRLFDEAEERDLDTAFIAEEKASDADPRLWSVADADMDDAAKRPIEAMKSVIAAEHEAPEAPERDPKAGRRRDKAFARRLSSLSAQLPLARVRRAARLVALALLVVLTGAGIMFRTEIVRSLPDLAGVYAALGMPVNVVGLEFRDVHTLMTLRNGTNVMKIDARIYSVAPRSVVVPPVVVTLLDDEGAALYEWSVAPDARDLESGEVVDFTTQLGSPPPGATRVRLMFSGGRAQPETPIAAAVQPKEPAH